MPLDIHKDLKPLVAARLSQLQGVELRKKAIASVAAQMPHGSTSVRLPLANRIERGQEFLAAKTKTAAKAILMATGVAPTQCVISLTQTTQTPQTPQTIIMPCHCQIFAGFLCVRPTEASMFCWTRCTRF